MADLVLKQHDTWPPLRMALKDENGLLDLTEADSAKLLLKNGTTLITGPVIPISPVDEDGMNAKYEWAASDTAITGDYAGEVEITWDAGTSPPEVETIPNSGTVTITIQPDQG